MIVYNIELKKKRNMINESCAMHENCDSIDRVISNYIVRKAMKPLSPSFRKTHSISIHCCIPVFFRSIKSRNIETA